MISLVSFLGPCVPAGWQPFEVKTSKIVIPVPSQFVLEVSADVRHLTLKSQLASSLDLQVAWQTVRHIQHLWNSSHNHPTEGFDKCGKDSSLPSIIPDNSLQGKDREKAARP